MSRSEARERIRIVVFEADTPAGKAFDVALITAIVASVVAVVLESVGGIRVRHGAALSIAEWLFTGLFTLEYLLRLWCVREPGRYARSFFGIVDLMAVLPTYLSLLLPGAHSLLVIRALRLLRVFRVFKLGTYLGEAAILVRALRASRHKITVFLFTVMTLVLILGALMYLIEGEKHGFDNIPKSMYWAIVTMTTVGYGDIAPQTVPGRMLAAVVMIIGYSIIAVPTGIVTSELFQAARRPDNTRTCPRCVSEGHLPDARFCRDCGAPFDEVGTFG